MVFLFLHVITRFCCFLFLDGGGGGGGTELNWYSLKHSTDFISSLEKEFSQYTQ